MRADSEGGDDQDAVLSELQYLTEIASNLAAARAGMDGYIAECTPGCATVPAWTRLPGRRRGSRRRSRGCFAA